MSKRKFIALSGLFGIVIATVLFVLGGPAQAQAPADPAPCVGSITGEGVATVTSGDCLLLAYAYSPDATVLGSFPDSLPQSLHDQVAGSVGTLTVALPPCAYQVDLVQSDAIVIDTLTEEYYGPNGWLVASQHGGSFCEETTTTTSTTQPEIVTTTTTIPITTITTAPAPTTTPTTIMSNTLARTGMNGQLSWIALGLMISGLGAVVYASTQET